MHPAAEQMKQISGNYTEIVLARGKSSPDSAAKTSAGGRLKPVAVASGRS